MNTKFSALTLATLILAFTSKAVEVEYQDTKVLLEDGDIKSFQFIDMNSDNRPDIVWLTNGGEVKYKLQDNNALVNFDSLAGTSWLLLEDHESETKRKKLEFTTEAGLITILSSGKFYPINNKSVTESGVITFCTDLPDGMNYSGCKRIYKITEKLPNMLKGIDLYSGDTWTATKLIR
ncbi:hypothetical protein [Pseudoalteromonas denitrificans]|jgi:hypothetical protein|uniref:VCBS repeat-containing protein n=1 Tax=Pseudoalteromonas denitrificans DSM 6059 TaxID=1123010 RepID=A0A1I1JMS2_9GAMM|nr:hypothetical protein [Pseudoalteromonas denitrificans]SFC47868.1 hypothetical protein SAMN02745724_01752 [Pseudoalteromonas denitrificans DSM 6059]